MTKKKQPPETGGCFLRKRTFGLLLGRVRVRGMRVSRVGIGSVRRSRMSIGRMGVGCMR